MSEAKTDTTEMLQPANLDLIPEDMEQYGALIAGLTTIQQRILWVMVENMASEIIRTDSALAVDIGVSRNTIRRARRNPTFQKALAVIVRENIRGLHDKLVGGIMQHGVKDWNAYKFLLQYDGSYVQKSQSMNINANITPDTPAGTPQGAIDASCMKFIAIGYDLERYVDEIRASWTRLKAEGV